MINDRAGRKAKIIRSQLLIKHRPEWFRDDTLADAMLYLIIQNHHLLGVSSTPGRFTV
jgi:hypothetical protein